MVRRTAPILRSSRCSVTKQNIVTWSPGETRFRPVIALLLAFILACFMSMEAAADHHPPTPTFPSATIYANSPDIRYGGGGIIMTMTPTPAKSANRQINKSANPDDGNDTQYPISNILFYGSFLCMIPTLGIALYAGYRTGWLQKSVVMLYAHREPVEIERRRAEKEKKRVLRDHQRRERERKKILRDIAKSLARETQAVLAHVGYCHEYREPGKRKKKIQPIQFSHAVIVGEEQVLLRVHRIPWKKSRWDLFSNAPGQGAKPVANGTTLVSWYATELYLALERQVQISFFEDIGIMFQIALKQGVAGVPKFVMWRDPNRKQFSMMDGDPFNEGKGRMPDVTHYPRTRLQIPIGLGRNRTVLRQDLVSLPHLIVSGATGTGKSNFLNQMICTWLSRNTPQTLQLFLIDLKVMEFAPYLALSRQDGAKGPSMIANVVQREREAVDELDILYKEIERRQRMMANICIDIDGWNELCQDDPSMYPLPRIVVIFDELSIVMLAENRDLANSGKRFLAKCLALGRASGVHMILCTQAINSKVVNMLITANTPGKMIFRSATRTASINALGDGRAWTHLEQPGMGFFCDERGGETIVQTPLIYEHQRDAIIEEERARIEGRLHEPRELTIEDVARYAHQNYHGKMAHRDMWRQFKGRIGHRALGKLIAAHYEKPLVLYDNGREYAILPSQGVGQATTITCVTMVHVPVPASQSHVTEISTDDIPLESAIIEESSDNGHHRDRLEIVEDPDDEDFDYEEYLYYRKLAEDL
jgi:hypothetical protein